MGVLIASDFGGNAETAHELVSRLGIEDAGPGRLKR